MSTAPVASALRLRQRRSAAAASGGPRAQVNARTSVARGHHGELHRLRTASTRTTTASLLPSAGSYRPRIHSSAVATTAAAVIALLCTVALLAVQFLPRSAMFALAAGNSAAGASSSAGGSYETIGDAKVAKVGIVGQGGNSLVYGAKNDKNKPVIVKKLLFGEKFSADDVAATKAARQYVSHSGGQMVQKIVGTHDLGNYLEEKKARPGGWKPNSADIIKQIDKQQEKAGYLHTDVRAGNIRVDANKRTGLFGTGPPKIKLIDWDNASEMKRMSPKLIESAKKGQREIVEDACRRAGFSFRATAADGGRIFRRGAGCGGGKMGTAGKTAAAAAGAGGKSAGRQNGAAAAVAAKKAPAQKQVAAGRSGAGAAKPAGGSGGGGGKKKK
ncbi:hypothetical protein DFJ73DRAFT_774649 [Zopfochytrium polystomum]|nr:hypothetical protein DFJ73DRAFT_774649 [Zopfochytrium polystomum]